MFKICEFFLFLVVGLGVGGGVLYFWDFIEVWSFFLLLVKFLFFLDVVILNILLCLLLEFLECFGVK